MENANWFFAALVMLILLFAAVMVSLASQFQQKTSRRPNKRVQPAALADEEDVV